MSCIYDRHDYREEVQAPLCQLMRKKHCGEKNKENNCTTYVWTTRDKHIKNETTRCLLVAVWSNKEMVS
jgi:hypothetical protein